MPIRPLPSPEQCRSTPVKPEQIDNAPDAVVAELANSQFGVVSRRQLAVHGLTPSMLEVRLARGLLVRLHRGVYGVGHRRLTDDGFWLAAVLAGGEGAALSHRDAAGLHGLRPSNRPRIEISTPAAMTSTPRLDVYGRRRLDPSEITAIAGIPVTTVARTLVDLADVVPGRQLLKVVNEAERRQVLDVRAVERCLERTRGRRGAGPAALRAVLVEHARRGTEIFRSDLEMLLDALVDRRRLARPRFNAIVEGDEVDAFWPPRLIVEADGWETHKTRQAFERDRAKDARLTALGYRVLRFTHRQIADDPSAVAAILRAAGAEPMAREPGAGSRRQAHAAARSGRPHAAGIASRLRVPDHEADDDDEHAAERHL
jgi:very-short-patch-repair endonuclease/predicted transcriptional regulator of viral defense system